MAVLRGWMRVTPSYTHEFEMAHVTLVAYQKIVRVAQVTRTIYQRKDDLKKAG